MPIPVQQFPILTPGQMSPFHQALQTGLEDYTNIAKAAYTPATMQADIASKQAYANYLPYQNISTALSNPLTLAMMSPDQRQLMFNALGQMAGNLKNNSLLNGSSTSSLWDNLKNWAMKSTGDNSQQNAISDYEKNHPEAMDALQKTGQYIIPGENNMPQQNQSVSTPSSNMAPSQNVFDTSSPQANALGIDTGNPEGNRALAKQMPSLALQNSQNQLKAQQIADAKIQANASQDAKTNALNEGLGALRLSRNADIFNEEYQNATIKGRIANLPGAGLFSRFDPHAYTAMNAANNMIGDVEQQLFGTGRPSDFRTKLSGTTKLELGMPEETEKNVFEKIKSMSARSMQHTDFNDYATKMGITDPNKRNSLWFDYNKDVPFYDVKGHKILNENLTDDSYQKYIQKAISKQSKTSAPTSNASPPNQNQGVTTVELDGKKYMHINGRWMPV